MLDRRLVVIGIIQLSCVFNFRSATQSSLCTILDIANRRGCPQRAQPAPAVVRRVLPLRGPMSTSA